MQQGSCCCCCCYYWYRRDEEWIGKKILPSHEIITNVCMDADFVYKIL